MVGARRGLWLPLGAFGTAWATTIAAGSLALPAMRRRRIWTERFREDGPGPAHEALKAGTPTAGGAFFVPIGIAAGLAFASAAGNLTTLGALPIAAATLACACIGFADDRVGLRARVKLVLQVSQSRCGRSR